MIEQFYDVVIDTKSFEDLGSSGWNVQMSKAAQELLDEYDKKKVIEELQQAIKSSKKIKDPQEKEKKIKEIEEKAYTKYDQWTTQDRPVIGVTGEKNKGKTFILSKITGVTLPVGHTIITKGISAKYIGNETTRYTFLDTVGCSATNVSLDTDLDLDKALQKVNAINKDKKTIESFLQNFVIEHSDIIIAVVGEMTDSEQEMLNKIKKCAKKRLCIVHNLMKLETKEQVENYINNTLKKLNDCNLKEQTYVLFNQSTNNGTSNDKYYTEKFKVHEDEEGKTIMHIIFASDKSEETRNYYNEIGIKFLKQQIEAEALGKKIDIIQKVIEHLEKNSSDFMKRSHGAIFYEEVKGNRIIVKNSDIKLKQILVNQIGEVNYSDSEYKPRMLVMIKQKGDKKQLVIDLEIPGEQPNITMKYKSEGVYSYFQCKGETNVKFDKYPGFHCKGEESNVHYELLFSNYEMKNEIIDFKFKLKLEKYTVKGESQTIDYFTENNKYNGIVRISYDIEETKTVEEEEDEEFVDL